MNNQIPINADELYARIGRLTVANDKLNELVVDLQRQVNMLQQMLRQEQEAQEKESD